MAQTNINDLLKNMHGKLKTEPEILAQLDALANELSDCFKQEAENPKLEGFVKALQWVLGKELYHERVRCFALPGTIGE